MSSESRLFTAWIVQHYEAMGVEEVQKLAAAAGLPPRGAYTVRALSRILGIGAASLYKGCYAGRIRHVRVGRRIYISAAEAARILNGEVDLTE